jgi:hypothetical protein
MLKGQDILVLAALLARDGPPMTLPQLAKQLSLGVGPIHRSLARLGEAGLVGPDRSVWLAQADEFLGHSLPYLFPPRMHGEARGIPTAWAASPLRERLAVAAGSPLVWAHPLGEVRGIEIEPIHPVVPEVARRSEDLYERLALIDALRAGDARVRGLAHEQLRQEFSRPLADSR